MLYKKKLTKTTLKKNNSNIFITLGHLDESLKPTLKTHISSTFIKLKKKCISYELLTEFLVQYKKHIKSERFQRIHIQNQ